MEEIVYFFAIAGFVSLYVTMIALTMRGILHALKNENDNDVAFAIFAGLFWPISIPVGLLVFWVFTIIRGPLTGSLDGTQEEEKPKNGNGKAKTNGTSKKCVKEEAESQTKFKIGDLVTGVKGNPGGYNKFYEGCICRVLYIDDEEVEVKLVDHMDREAHKDDLGQVSTLPIENMTLIKMRKPAKKKENKVAKKKK